MRPSPASPGRSVGRWWRSPLTAEGRLDVAAIDEALAANPTDAASRRTVLLLCSPHNPTGVVHTADELAAVAGVRAASRRPGDRGRGARAARPGGRDVRALVRGRRPRLRGHLSGQGVQPRRPQGGPDRRRSGEPRPAQAAARLRRLRRQPPRRDRALGRVPLGPVVAGGREHQHRDEPGAAGRTPRRTSAGGGLPDPAGDLSRVAGPARGRPRPGPGPRCCSRTAG